MLKKNPMNVLHFDVSKQKLSQKVIISEIGVGIIAIVVFPLDAKIVVMKFVYVIKHMLRFIYEIFKKNSFSILYAITFCLNLQSKTSKVYTVSVDLINNFVKL